MATASENQLDVKIILMNNEALGLVHQQQSLFYEQGVFAATYPGKIKESRYRDQNNPQKRNQRKESR